MINITVWNEHIQDKEDEDVIAVYPDSINACIAGFLGEEKDFKVTCATQDMPECGLGNGVLENTDVLIWWGHCGHEGVPDELVEKIHDRILRGMGLIVLHSAHYSKIFIRTMGTSCSLHWREGDRERLWNIAPNHPIAQGIGRYLDIDREEMYGERFDIPEPDETVFLGWFKGGEVFRSGCCWNRGLGKVFYFQPGHETNPTYYIKEIQTIIKNAVRWAAPLHIQQEKIDAPHAPVSPEQAYLESKK
jgi:trehalose utilization protein